MRAVRTHLSLEFGGLSLCTVSLSGVGAAVVQTVRGYARPAFRNRIQNGFGVVLALFLEHS